jgi:hypothetical protein
MEHALLETRGVQNQLSAPTIVHDPTRRWFPILVRIVLRLIGADNFMQLSPSSGKMAHQLAPLAVV